MMKNMNEKLFFFKRSIKNVKQFGALLPSSQATTRKVASKITDKDSWIIELGAGSGNSTQSIIESGVDPKKLVAVEIDADCCNVLKDRFPDVTVLNINARDLRKSLSSEVLSNVGTIVSSIPFFNFDKGLREEIFRECFNVLRKDGKLIIFSYSPIAPIETEKLGIIKKRVGFVIKNIPPIYIWEYKNEEYKNAA